MDWTPVMRPMYVSLSQCPNSLGWLSLAGDFRAPGAGVGDDSLFVQARQLAGIEQLFAANPQVFDAGAAAGIK
ncbi:hypothetical protein PSEUDO9AZ_10361 [Pseudomonas sp. 9AZ]|nr:hypothetical protein PSEUDO9AZ_10361 [Pseudomonas sp. 9AZ]